MERWSGKVAVVTGASSGIGAAIARDLVKHGLQVVGLARRVHRLEELSAELSAAPGRLHPLKCDVTKETDVLISFAWVKQQLGTLKINALDSIKVMLLYHLKNCCCLKFLGFTDFKTEDWLQMLNVNTVGLTLCTRQAIKSMRERGVNDGHVVYINSFLGHTMSNSPGFNMYATTKHATTALAESLRRELLQLKTRIRVSSISPGLVRTEMLSAGITRTVGPDIYNTVNCLEPNDVSNAVAYVLGTPPHVQIQELILLPTGQS
ncbi:farnesol dehydrogenase-like [Zootermopsis nevadensis]|uniref:farnesol dehydrogenase-like n=1 Tax=Zootermopsis nevadensis TaxID=136037 RepID=UPI000B8EA6F0|nr:farnesol dehydrogenase-like [Zootermopsis nevadensis]